VNGKTRVIFIIASVFIATVVLSAGYSIFGIVRLQDADLQNFREAELERTKRRLKNFVDIALANVSRNYENATDLQALEKSYGGPLEDIVDVVEGSLESKADKVRNGVLSLGQAQQEAIKEVRKIRYDEGKGFVWILDAAAPNTTILMHPIEPSLEGPVDRTDPKLRCALGEEALLTDAIVDKCLKDGAGYVDFVLEGPKLAYARLFSKWGWIIVTEFRVDDAIYASQVKSIAELKQMRYDNGAGYFWVNDTTSPIPGMIMHPTHPDLDGKILDDPSFDCAQEVGKNLFQAAREVSEANGDGYVDYRWTKPTADGRLIRDVPKLSYVRLYEPLNWIIGTGAYVDDTEKAVADYNRTIEEENDSLIWRILAVSLGSCILGLAFLTIFVRRSLPRLAERDLLQRNVELELETLARRKAEELGQEEPESETSHATDHHPDTDHDPNTLSLGAREETTLLAFKAALEEAGRAGSRMDAVELLEQVKVLSRQVEQNSSKIQNLLDDSDADGS
jgi:methyl-accepting chemotaxis protein